jgi:cytochrome c
MPDNRTVLAGVLAACVWLGSCGSSDRSEAASVTGGDSARGLAAISKYGCGSCHTIPGVAAAHGLVGPSLAGVGARVYVGGVLPNMPSNMMRWIRDPVGVDEKSAMPNLGVTAGDAADIAAYLYSAK